ncbi:MAG: ABC transporter ATP-binding protein [Anaeroplasmataceae bacterium]|nr:ABC transporter ATP-binding protein [Anaeroplasmataceae bacterium]
MAYVEFDRVTKKYVMGTQEIIANKEVSFQIHESEFCVIVGPSGAGKTTILNLLGGMESCDSGKIIVDEKEISQMSEKDLTNYRRYDVGFVFQFYNLMPNLTAYENLEIAVEISKNPLDPKEVLQSVGLMDRMNNFPAQLSGGEQQRISIARAIAKNPKILLCDEPTGALDYLTGKSILKLLHDTCRNASKTVIVITHNAALTKMADHVIRVKNGEVVEEYYNEHPLPIEEIEW